MLHGLLLPVFPNSARGRGTATLIGKNCIITAAHCLYDQEHGGMAARAEFFLGVNNGTYYYKRSLVKEVRIHSLYAQGCMDLSREKRLNHDIAVASIEEDIGQEVGWASLKVFKDADLSNIKVNITGYPSPVANDNVSFTTYKMHTMEGPITQTDDYRIHYDIDTFGGQSGSGVWRLGKDRIVDCLGVHANGYTEEDKYNNGTRINEEKFDIIQSWLNQINK